MKNLSRIASAIGPSATLDIDTLYKKMKAEGQDVIGFGVGEPDFSTPDNIKQAGIRAIVNNDTKYTASNGTLELRNAIANRLSEDYGVIYDAQNISVSNGAKPCIYVSLRTLVNPGDEVILPSPYWVSYIELIRMVGGIPVIIETTEEEQFKLSPEKLQAAITPKTKCMILNNPSNPTGMVYNRQELETIAAVCVENDIYVIADEIYSRLVYDNKEFVSLSSISPEIKERTLLINGVSKAYAMTGWRIGYVATPMAIAKIISNYLSHCTGSPSAVSQKAAVAALSDSQASIEAMRREFEARRNYMVERINCIDRVSCICPEGAFYVMMNIEQFIGEKMCGTIIRTSEDFANLFLKHAKVSVIPGAVFGAPEFIRWSYATSIENIAAGMDRLECFLREL